MKAKAIKVFRDNKSRVMRNIGDEFEVTPERLAEINGTKYGILVEEVNESAQETPGDQAQDEKPEKKNGRDKR
jgi:hypothetical protein